MRPTLTEPDFLVSPMPSVFLIHLGVGARLKGGGKVPPSSKYDIHRCDRANFHSVSERSCRQSNGLWQWCGVSSPSSPKTTIRFIVHRNVRFLVLTEMIWYELDIMAMSMLSSTMMLMTEYEPNMSNAQKRVKLLIP